MRQTLLAEFAPAPAPADGSVALVDLFCGAGGFSQGAAQAGLRVALAVDASEDALETHRRNHPGARHACLRLPEQAARLEALLPLAARGGAWHLHGSPPCNRFSTLNAAGRRQGDRAQAEAVLRWFLRFAGASGARSWSMENVASASCVAAARAHVAASGGAADCDVFDFSLFGVPQTRKRLIAGSRALVRRLRELCASPLRRSVADVLARPKGTHVRSGKSWLKMRARDGGGFAYERASPGDHCRPISEPAPTVTTSSTCWATPEGRRAVRFRFSVAELAALQTFPADYRWPARRGEAFRQIANAVPCAFAQRLLEAVT